MNDLVFRFLPFFFLAQVMPNSTIFATSLSATLLDDTLLRLPLAANRCDSVRLIMRNYSVYFNSIHFVYLVFASPPLTGGD